MPPRPAPPRSGSESQSVAPLVLSLVGFVLASACGPIGGIVCVIAGWMAYSAQNKARERGQSDSMAKAALILSIIGGIFSVLWCGLFGLSILAETL